jgi:hypothetical protein
VATRAVIDYSRFVANSQPLPILDRRDTGIEFRRLLTLSHLSRALHQPRVSLPPGYTPDLHQMKPMSLLERGWFHDLLQVDSGGNKDTKSPKYLRKGLVVADEGGMGKTLSCVIAALKVLDDSNQTVLVLCPPLLKNHWLKLFEHTQHDVHFWNGTKLVKESIPRGVILLSKHSLLGQSITDARKKQLQENIKLVIVDEAHEWFISAAGSNPSDDFVDDDGLNENNGGKSASFLREIVHTILSSGKNANQCLLVTATPMRKGFGDFFSLVELLEPGLRSKFEERIGSDANSQQQWIQSLSQNWFPLLEKIRVCEDEDLHPNLIQVAEHLKKFAIFLEDSDCDILIEKLVTANFLHSLRGEDGLRLRQELINDLHPLGRYLSVSLRDDLDATDCEQRYRMMESRTFGYSFDSALDEMVNQLTSRGDKLPRNWKQQLFDCPMNLLGQYHSTKFSLHFNEHQTVRKKLLPRVTELWDADERLSYLKDLINDLLGKNKTNIASGVVIFSRFKNTCFELQQALEIYFQDRVDVYLFLPPIIPKDGSDPISDSRHRDLKRAREKSVSSPKLQIIVSGESGSVGLDMEWANHIVHWTPSRSFGMISQKTWRLDRRISQSNADSTGLNFVVHHFCETKNIEAHRSLVNQSYRNARILLGDRQDLTESKNELIPPISNENFTRQWSNTSRDLLPSGSHSRWLWGFVNGVEGGLNSVAELIGIQSLSALTGINLSVEELLSGEGNQNYQAFKTPNAPLGYRLNQLDELILLDGYSGVTPQRLHKIMTCTESNHELSFLKSCAGGIIDAPSLLPPSGRATMLPEHKSVKLTPMPTGELHSFFTKKLRELYFSASLEAPNHQFVVNQYPYVHYHEDNSGEPLPCVKIGLHLGLLDFLESEAGLVMKRVLGKQCISGFVSKDSNDWKYLSYGELEQHQSIFELILDDAHLREYPDDYFPNSNSAQEDREAFLSEDLDYRALLEPNIDLFLQGYTFEEQVKHFEKYAKMLPFESIMFLPLVNIHAHHGDGRNGCSVCGNESFCGKGSLCYDEWDPKDGDGIGGWC